MPRPMSLDVPAFSFCHSAGFAGIEVVLAGLPSHNLSARGEAEAFRGCLVGSKFWHRCEFKKTIVQRRGRYAVLLLGRRCALIIF